MKSLIKSSLSLNRRIQIFPFSLELEEKIMTNSDSSEKLSKCYHLNFKITYIGLTKKPHVIQDAFLIWPLHELFSTQFITLNSVAMLGEEAAELIGLNPALLTSTANMSINVTASVTEALCLNI